jgi:hypothetical protein
MGGLFLFPAFSRPSATIGSPVLSAFFNLNSPLFAARDEFK